MNVSLAGVRKRLPVRLRQHWKPLTAGVAGVAVALAFFGDVTIRPYSTSSAAVTDDERITQDITGTVDLFDGSVDHEISLSYTQTRYDEMLDAYFAAGEKEWMSADITIDGTTIQDVAVRLKGNSTLSALVDNREGSDTEGERAPGGMGGEGGGMRQPPEGMEPPAGMEMPEGGRPDDGEGGGFGRTGVSLTTDEPENLPLLVSFDENEPGRAYQGRTELSIRPASASSTSSLNEAVALELTARSGQPTQAYTYTTYAVNDRPTTTRLVVENPDPQYADGLEGDGVLYKLLSTSSFEYQGDDQTEYTDDFSQVNLVGSQDLQPIVSFLKWLDGASDEEFADELDDWVDVESFARYLGTQEVLDNFDTISGPGKNAYLYYDLDTGLISVVSWDLNLALSGMSGSCGMGGGRMPDADGDQGPPEGRERGPDGGGGMGGMANQNPLVTRFEGDADFSAIIDAAVGDLTGAWIDSGKAAALVDEVAARVPVTDGVDRTTIDADARSVRTKLTADDGADAAGTSDSAAGS